MTINYYRCYTYTYKDMELIQAVRHNDIDRVRVLLDEDANTGIQDMYGRTPLIYGCIYNYMDIVRLLLDRGVDIDQQGEYGDTPLIYASIYASIYNHMDIVRLLLEHGADPSIRSNNGNMAYTVSSREEIREILRSYIAKRGSSLYQIKDRSREYMSSVYSDISIVV